LRGETAIQAGALSFGCPGRDRLGLNRQ
jgi:hypothetical protein